MNRALIIGYGSIGSRHHEVLKAVYPGSQVDLVSGHLEKSAGIYKSIAEVPDLGSYDYYVIATKTIQHFTDLSTLDRAVTGKRILLEKPAFAEYANYTSAGNNIFVGYNLRFHPIIAELRNRVQKRKVLSVSARVGQYLPSWRPGTDYRFSYSARKEEGGGVLLDLSHEIDYLQWIFGRFGSLRAVSTKISSLDINSDDFTAVLGRTVQGIYLVLTMDYLSREPVRSCVVQCEESTIFADLIANELREVGEGINEPFVAPPVKRNDTYAAMHQDIIKGGVRVACTLAEGLEVLSTIELIKNHAQEDWIG